MAEKKKKYIPFKDAVTPRRPVILKSERDPPKESEKVKVEKPLEKEKQPTILLKPRDPSTPKDENRPQSPKTPHSTDNIDCTTPSKIAHNDSKEKKVCDQKNSQPIPAMTECVKFLDDKLEFNPAAGDFLDDSNSNYLVVGILGAQGVGKSMIMNLLSHENGYEDLCSRILETHEQPLHYEETGVNDEQMDGLNFVEGAERRNGESSDYFKFRMQDIEKIMLAQHCTTGIDMYVTQDRVILLDSQPLFSPSAHHLLRSGVPGAIPVTVRGSTLATVDCLQMTSYLMSICHVLIVTQDWFTDCNLMRFILSAEMLRPSLSGWSAEGAEGGGPGGGGGAAPHLLLLHNRCQLEDYRPGTVRVMQDTYRKMLNDSKLQLNSGMYLYSDLNRNGPNIEAVSPGLTVDACGPPINLFLLPEIYDDYDNYEIYRGHPPFPVLARRLMWTVHGVNRHQITNVANLSEKGWFHYCSKAWETIRKSTFFMEYGRLLP